MSKQYEIKFYIGTGFDFQGNPVGDVDLKLNGAVGMLTKSFQGVTRYDHTGYWAENSHAPVVKESGVTFVTVVGAELLPEVTVVANYLRDLFNQNCVLVTRSVIEAEFV